MTKLVLIQDAIPSDGFQFGGEIMNQFVLLFSGEPLDTEEDIRINTTFKFYSGKLALYDNDPTLSHKLFIKVENIDTGLDKSVTFRNPTVQDDFFMTESQIQVVKNKVWSTGNSVTADLPFTSAAITGATISGALNTFSNIPHAALLQITDKAKLHSNTVYNDQNNTYGVGAIQSFRTGMFKIYDTNASHRYTISTGDLTTDITLTIPVMSSNDSFAFLGVINLFSTWQKIQYAFTTALVLYRPENTALVGTGISFNLQNSNNSEASYGLVSASIVSNVAGAEAGQLVFSVKNAGSLSEKLVLTADGKAQVGPINQKAILDPTGITSNRNFTFPNQSGQIVTQEFANIFTNIQTIQANFANLMSIYRTINTVNESVGVTFDAWSSTGVKRTYAGIRTTINDNTNTSEDANFVIDLMLNGTLGTKLLVHGNGNLFIGASQRLVLSENGLTAQRVITFADVTGKVVLDTFANSFTNKQKIQWNGSQDTLSLFRGNAAAINNFAGEYYSALNDASAEIIYAAFLAGTGNAAADIVAGTERGQIRLQILESGALTTKLQMVHNRLYSYGMVPDIQVGSGDLQSMFIYRPVNSSGSAVIYFDLQTAASARKSYGYLGIRSEIVTAGAEVGSVQLGAAEGGTIQLQLKVHSYKTWLYNAGGFAAQLDPSQLTAHRNFSLPNLAGQFITDTATQTMLSKTLTSPTITSPTMSGDITAAARLDIVRTAGSGEAEQILRLRVSDDPNSYLQFDSATTGATVFYPRMTSFNNHTDNGAVGMFQYFNITPTSDSADHNNAAAIFDVRRSNNTEIVNKRLFQFRNFGTNVFQIYIDKFDFTSKKLINAIFNINESIIKHGTTNAAGDILVYDTTAAKYDRKAIGANGTFLGVSGGVFGYYTPVGVGAVLALSALTDDVNIATPTDGQILIYRSAGGKWKNEAPSFAGEANTYSNGGTGGISIILTKSGVNLPFKSMIAASTKLSVADGGANNRVEFDVNEANLNIANMTGSLGNARLVDLAWSKLTGIPDASTTVKGIVELATSAETTATLAVAANDTRLSDARVPTAHAASHASGQPDQLSIVNLAGNIGNSRITDLAYSKLTSVPSTFAPSAHQTSHAQGGTDALTLTGIKSGIVTKTANATLANTESIILGDANSGNITLTLPAAASSSGVVYIVQKINSNANTVTIDPNASETINGAATLVLSIQYQTVVIWCNGTAWFCDPLIGPVGSHVHSGADITSGTVPIANLPTASETAKGIAELATSAETTAGLVVQASDTRLSNARTPTAHNHSAADINAGTLPVARGGTNKTTMTQHALLKGGASNAIDELAVGTEDQVLAVVSGTPAWKSLNAERTGTALANGGATVYNIPHGLGVDPYCAFIQCSSHSIAFTYATTSTNIVVTFVSAPGAGTNNVKFHWRAVA